MANLPDRLLRGLAKRDTSPTGTAHPEKITHAVERLNQAGVGDSIAGVGASTTTTAHPEKITHIMNKLTQAGMGDGSSSTSSTKHDASKKWIIVGAVIGAVVLIVALLGAWLCFRRYKKRKAYAVVSRGVDESNTKGKGIMKEKNVEMFNADAYESEGLSIGPVVKERNFENGYDNVDTEYEGSKYGAPSESHGDKRARFEA